MNPTSSLIERFPAELRLAEPECMPEFQASYERVHSLLGHVEVEARLRDAAAQGWIILPSRRRRKPNPISLPGRPLSELLNEVRE